MKDLCLNLTDRWLFRKLSFVVPCSSFVAITGPSGVGKTSLMRLLSGDLKGSEATWVQALHGWENFDDFSDLQLSNGANWPMPWVDARQTPRSAHFGFPQGIVVLRPELVISIWPPRKLANGPLSSREENANVWLFAGLDFEAKTSAGGWTGRRLDNHGRRNFIHS